ncbi:hypothetical protein JQ633_00920 [Bradyrhizobium tropiciagri]|nr:hypothetical protein [Bradyrhizobium tropiciagri]MBR0868902.1 hypothetical protein [Bradyrhizobium tropiciagri]
MITPTYAQSFGGPQGTGAMPMSFAEHWPSLILIGLALAVVWLLLPRRLG